MGAPDSSWAYLWPPRPRGGVPEGTAHALPFVGAEDVAAAIEDPSSGAADEHELMWFALQELRYLAEESQA